MQTAATLLVMLLAAPVLAARRRGESPAAALRGPESHSDEPPAVIAHEAEENDDQDPGEAVTLPALDAASSALLEDASEGTQNRSQWPGRWSEDVECFCIDYYEYVDWDDYSHYRNPSDCMSGHSRCNEKCEKRGKHIVLFERKRQTISFCGTDEGWPSSRPECQCLDGKDTFKHSNKKKAMKKFNNPNILTQFAHGAAHAYDGYGSNAANLRACYQHCPQLCAQRKKLTGGCAMPVDA